MKRIISLSLTLLLCIALSVPAFAGERAVPTVAEGLAPVQITLNQGGGSYDFSYGAKDVFFVESPMRFVMDESDAGALDGYHAVSGNSTFTVRHNGKAGDGSFITVSLDSYLDDDGTKNLYYYDGGVYLVNAGYFIDHALDPDVPEFGGLVELTAGQSVTFSIPFGYFNDGGDELVMLHVSIAYPELDHSYWTNCWLKLDEKNAAVKPQPAASAFSDVAAKDWFADSVRWAIEKGITNGTSSTAFSPNDTCTQEQIITFLYRANGTPATSISNPYADVTANAWYYDAVRWGYQNGLRKDASFGVAKPCSRSDVVFYLWTLAGKPAPTKAAAFTDVPDGASYAQAVAWAVEKGITTGTGAAAFSPNDTCTRAQIVTFLYRAYK